MSTSTVQSLGFVVCGVCETRFDTTEERLAHRLQTGHKGVFETPAAPAAAPAPAPAVPTTSGRFEVVPNGFGGTTTRPANRQPNFRRITGPADRATQKQVDFIRSLLAEREGIAEAEAIRERLNTWREQGGVNKAGASKVIEDLKAIPRPVREAAAPAAPAVRTNRFAAKCEDCRKMVGPEEGRLSKADDGSWEVRHLDGECPETDFPFPYGRYAIEVDGVMKFYAATEDGLYAQASDELHPVRSADSRKEIIAAIAEDALEASKRYGREFETCGRCGRGLTSDWRKVGIGPVCVNKPGWS